MSLLTTREVAERLRVSVTKVLRMTRRGELPGFRLPGGALRFDSDELDAWLKKRATSRRGALTAAPEAARDGRLSSVGLTAVRDEED